jgi:hypothetical protein
VRRQIFGLILMLGFVFGASHALAQPADSDSSSDVAKQLQNPVGNLTSIPFQSNTNFNAGPHGGVQNVLNIQPVVPFHLNADWNIIERAILPLVWSPSLLPAPSTPFGAAPANFSTFFSPAKPVNGLVWGFGPVIQAPTASDPTLGSNVWGAGPTGVLVYMTGPWVIGVLANNIWSFGGTTGPGGTNYSTFLTQPFINYNLPGGWYFGTSPLITANWQANGDKWTVPLGGNVGRVIKFGKLPVNISVGAYYNVVTPTYGPNWQLRTQVAFVF